MDNKRTKQNTQDIQDSIFRRMTADEKVILGSELWRLGRDIAPEKVLYGRENRSTGSSREDS